MLGLKSRKTVYHAPQPQYRGLRGCWQRISPFLPSTWLLYGLRFSLRWLFVGLTLLCHGLGHLLIALRLRRLGRYFRYLQLDVSQAVLFGERHIGRLHVDRQAALDRIRQITKKDTADDAYDVQESTVVTHDGAVLDTVEFSRRKKITYDDPTQQRYIIKLLGRDQHYEDRLRRFLKLAKDREANVILFNFRGVGHSKKKALVFNDLVTDGIAQVQRVLDRFWEEHPDLRPGSKGAGAYPMIALEGFSLGGAVGTMVTRYFHDRGIKIFLFNDRSFSSLTNTVIGIVVLFLEGLGIPELPSKLLAYALWPLTKLVMLILGWDASIAHVYANHIPSAYREYTVVPAYAGGRLEKFSNARDRIINYNHASLHKSRHVQKHYKRMHKRLDEAVQRSSQRVEQLTRQLRIAEKHYHCLSHIQRQSRYAHISRKLTGFSGSALPDAHRTSLETLANVHGALGSDVMSDFYHRCCKQHEKDVV